MGRRVCCSTVECSVLVPPTQSPLRVHQRVRWALTLKRIWGAQAVEDTPWEALAARATPAELRGACSALLRRLPRRAAAVHGDERAPVSPAGAHVTG